MRRHAMGGWLAGLILISLLAGEGRAQLGDSSSFLNALDLNFSQYSERMGLSQWAFNQNFAATGMGSSAEVNARGRARIKSGKAGTAYRPVSADLAEAFAGSRTSGGAKRSSLAQAYRQFLGRFRDAQRGDHLGERDVASALGLAFASNYEIYSDGKVADPAQERDIVKQFREALLKDAYFQGTNDRYRQLLDENTAVQTVAGLVAYRNAARRGDREAIEAERRKALAFLDFYWPGSEDRARKIRLTAAGFRG